MSEKLRLAGVMGWPVEHSLSPKLHNYWLKQLGVDGEYLHLSIKPNDLAKTFRSLPSQDFVGWNITVPHKEAALQLVHEVDEAAYAIGAVNTVTVKPDGRLRGSNTDAYGFIQNLKATLGDLTFYKPCAMVIGAGGAARAVIYALKKEGFSRILVTNRTLERINTVTSSCDVVEWGKKERALEKVTLLINTTSLGMEGQPPLDMPLSFLQPDAAVCDIVYKPLITPLLAEAKQQGNKIITGIGMLIHQAVPGFEAWFGVRPSVTPALTEMLLA